MKTKLNLLFIILGSLLIIIGINFRHTKVHNVKQIDSTLTVQLSFVGDLMCHSPQFNSAKIKKDSFNFKPAFRFIKSYLEKSDATFGNFETVVAGIKERISGYPYFNTPEEYLEGLSNAGFDVLFTANNHSADRKKKGIFSTIENVKKYGMIPIGTYTSQNDRDSVRIIDIKGLKIGLQAYTYGLNGNVLPKNENYLVNVIDTNLIRSDIKKIKNSRPDLIIIYFHFGEEYSRKPSEYQKEIAAKTFAYGADIIIASHPHVIQAIEYSDSATGKLQKGLIAYSLGNFYSNQQWRYSDAGVILNLEITKNIPKDSLWINNVSSIPTWVFRGNTGNKIESIILPSDTSLIKPLPAFLKKEDIAKINQAFEDTRQMLGTKSDQN